MTAPAYPVALKILCEDNLATLLERAADRAEEWSKKPSNLLAAYPRPKTSAHFEDRALLLRRLAKIAGEETL